MGRVASGVVLAACLICLTVSAAQDTRPAGYPKTDPNQLPASPRSSHDLPQRDIAANHSRPMVQSEGQTYLWAKGSQEAGDVEWFDMTDALIDPVKFQFGIGKDRVPSIDDPKFLPYGDQGLAVHRIGDQTDVIGFVHNGVAKAYPLFILDRHEIVNDEFAGSPYGVYW